MSQDSCQFVSLYVYYVLLKVTASQPTFVMRVIITDTNVSNIQPSYSSPRHNKWLETMDVNY